jgi:hypothetical protein
VLVSAQEAINIAALGAAALAHSASKIASASLGANAPGLVQLLGPLDGAGCTIENEPAVYVERPNVLRKVLQSDVLNTSVSSISTMVWSWPE